MNIINTPRGPKTPKEALELLKKASLAAGDMLNILNQLVGYPEGKEAIEWTLGNLNHYNGKIRQIVQKKYAEWIPMAKPKPEASTKKTPKRKPETVA